MKTKLNTLEAAAKVRKGEDFKVETNRDRKTVLAVARILEKRLTTRERVNGGFHVIFLKP